MFRHTTLISLLAVACAIPCVFSGRTAGAVPDASFQRRDAGMPLPEASRLAELKELSALAGADATASEGADPDDGEQQLLVRPANSDPWLLLLPLGFEYQSNAALAPERETGDFVLRGGASLRRTIPLNGHTFADAGVSWQFYRYHELDVLDFDRLEGDLSLHHAVSGTGHPLLDGTVISLRAGHYRLTAPAEPGESFFDDTSLSIGLSRMFVPAPHQSVLASLTAQWSIDASSITAQRDEYTATLQWQARWAPHWETSLWARTAYYDYEGHADWNFNAGIAINWVPRDWFRAGISAGWVHNDSSRPVFDYSGVNAGLAASFTLLF